MSVVEISSWTELDAVRLVPGGDYLLTRDLLSTDGDYAGIGSSWVPIDEFSGSFDGGCCKIHGVEVRSNAEFVGFFGRLMKYSVVKDVALRDIFVSGTREANYPNIGGFAGYIVDGATVIGCSVTGRVEQARKDSYPRSSPNVGGFAGKLGCYTSTVKQCSFNGDVECLGDSYNISSQIGGMFGQMVSSASQHAISECFSKGSVTFSGTQNMYDRIPSVGGFVGYKLGTGQNLYIDNCYSNSDVFAPDLVVDLYNVGGFAGLLYNYNFYSYTNNCYSSGQVFCPNGGGGFVGRIGLGASTNKCYYDTETSGKSDEAGNTIPKTTAAMMQQSTFENWDFDDIWQIDDGNDYPRLQWASPPPPAQVEVPNIVGETQVVAESAITGAGLTIGSITSQHSATVAVGLVISQQPAAGGMVDIGSAVGFVVSLGENPTPPVPPKPQPTGKFSGETVILFDSILEQPGVTITASSTAAGTFLENLKNDTTFEYWASGTIGEA